MEWHGGSGSGCAVVWFIFRPNKSGADRHDETGTVDGPGPCLDSSLPHPRLAMLRCFFVEGIRRGHPSRAVH